MILRFAYLLVSVAGRLEKLFEKRKKLFEKNASQVRCSGM